MGIQLGSNFTVNTALPLDDRILVADITARNAILAGRRYRGMIVHVESDGKNYQLVGGILDVNWIVVGGGGGGGGGGANWQPALGSGPVESYEFAEKVWLYSQDIFQNLELWVKIPTSYSAGGPLILKGSFYSPSTSNVFAFSATGTLIRRNTDAINSTANSNIVTSADVTNTVARQLREITFTISAAGLINSVAITAGDIVRVVLQRATPVGTDDTQDIRFIPSATEVLFA